MLCFRQQYLILLVLLHYVGVSNACMVVAAWLGGLTTGIGAGAAGTVWGMLAMTVRSQQSKCTSSSGSLDSSSNDCQLINLCEVIQQEGRQEGVKQCDEHMGCKEGGSGFCQVKCWGLVNAGMRLPGVCPAAPANVRYELFAADEQEPLLKSWETGLIFASGVAMWMYCTRRAPAVSVDRRPLLGT